MPRSATRIDELIFVALEHRVVGPVAEDGRDVEVADDVARQLLDRIEQRRHVDFPHGFGAD